MGGVVGGHLCGHRADYAQWDGAGGCWGVPTETTTSRCDNSSFGFFKARQNIVYINKYVHTDGSDVRNWMGGLRHCGRQRCTMYDYWPLPFFFMGAY